jgi:peptidoglycan/LPS O-acetylase OafA/YrhL
VLTPYYAASGLLLAVALASFAGGHTFSAPGTAPLHARDILAQIFLLDRAGALASPPYWTLIVELRWYLIFPMLLLVWMRAPRAFGLLVVAVAAGYWFTRLHNVDLGVLPAFMLGIVAADLRVRHHALCRFALPLALASVAVALALEPQTVMPNQYGLDEKFFIWQTNPGWHCAAFFTVLAAGEVSWFRRFLGNPLLAFGGIASYSIYLMHYPIVMFAGPYLLRNSTAGGFLATVALAVAGGILFWLVVERWFCTEAFRTRACIVLTPGTAWAFTWLHIPAVLAAGKLTQPAAIINGVADEASVHSKQAVPLSEPVILHADGSGGAS